MVAYDQLPKEIRDIIKTFPIWTNSVSIYNLLERKGKNEVFAALKRIYFSRTGKTNLTKD